MNHHNIPYFPLSTHTVRLVQDGELVQLWLASRVRKKNDDGYWFTFLVTEEVLLPKEEYSVEVLMDKKDLFLNFCYLKQITTEFAPDRYKVDEQQIPEDRRLLTQYASWTPIRRM